MIPLPSLRSALVDKLGRMVPPWNSWFQQFTDAPTPVMALTVGASPFSYEAKEPGTIIITGGTVTQVNITRGTETINLGTNNIIPVAIKDVVTVIYAVLPTVKFLARF